MPSRFELAMERAISVRLAIAALCLAAFVSTTSLAVSGQAAPLDAWAARWFEDQHNPTRDLLMSELTSLGGDVALTSLTIAAAGFLASSGHYRSLVLWLSSIVGARLLNVGIRLWTLRPRPGPAPFISEMDATSFPSGHAMMSMAVYLTLALLCVRLIPRRRVQTYVVTAAILLSLSIGLSRVYLGYHHFTDVIAGWTAAIFWVTVCFEAGPLYRSVRTLVDFRRWHHSHRPTADARS